MGMILPDIVATGIYNSNAVVRNRTVTKNRKTTMFEIEIPIEEGGTSFINSKEMAIKENLLICAKPGQIRHTKLPFKCYYIHMILKEGELYDLLIHIPDYIEVENAADYVEIFRKICRCFDISEKRDLLLLYSLLLKLIYDLHEASKKQSYQYKAKKYNSEMIEKALTYIKENLSDTITLEKVADHVSFSPVYFHNCFKAATGRTLHEYVEEKRISHAADLLITTDKTLTEIAYLCGFSSQSYFSYAFKRRMNITPREYVKKVCSRYEQQDQP